MNPASSVVLDFPRCLAAEHPAMFDLLWSTVASIVEKLPGMDFTNLERRSPALRGYDWASYLQLSAIRMARSIQTLQRHGFSAGALLDYGSYFGNFAAFAASLGYRVTAVDGYGAYRPSLQDIVAFLKERDVSVVDFETVGYELQGLPAESFDVVLCMGVIEHVPHTPRLVLESINRVLRPGGVLVLDTPNLAYLYKRRALAAGASIFTPITTQYHTELPFEGHHREFTREEVEWMLSQLRHELLATDMFCYSIFGLQELRGADAEAYALMQSDPSLREIIMTVSRKTVTA